MNKDSNIKAQFLIIIAAMIWGTTGSIQAIGPKGLNPIVLGALRVGIGGTAMIIYAIFKGEFCVKGINKKMIIWAALSIGIYQPVFFFAVKKTGVALGTLLTIGSAPIFSGIIDTMRGSRPNKRWIIATTISIIGCILMIGGGSKVQVNIIGMIFALVGGCIYSCFVVASQSALKNGNRTTVNALIFFISGIILMPVLIVSDITWMLNIKGTVLVLYVGIITTALAYTLFGKGVIKVNSSKAVTLTLAEPLTAAFLGIVILKESSSTVMLFGMVILIIGIVIGTRDGMGSKRNSIE